MLSELSARCVSHLKEGSMCGENEKERKFWASCVHARSLAHTSLPEHKVIGVLWPGTPNTISGAADSHQCQCKWDGGAQTGFCSRESSAHSLQINKHTGGDDGSGGNGALGTLLCSPAQKITGVDGDREPPRGHVSKMMLIRIHTLTHIHTYISKSISTSTSIYLYIALVNVEKSSWLSISTRCEPACMHMHARRALKTQHWRHTVSLELTLFLPPGAGKVPILPTDRSADQFSMFSSHAWTWSFLCALCLQYVMQVDTCTCTSTHWDTQLEWRQIYFCIWHTFNEMCFKLIHLKWNM